jgi:hypothetical protein
MPWAMNICPCLTLLSKSVPDKVFPFMLHTWVTISSREVHIMKDYQILFFLIQTYMR